MKAPSETTRETVLEIDLDALIHNYRYLRSKLKSNTKIMGVVKAFGYGSDAIQVAKALVTEGVNYFAVAYVEEGVALRDAGIQTPILVLHPQPSGFQTLIKRCLEPALYSPRIFKAFTEVAEQQKQKDYPVHIKFNTGLNRLGFWESDSRWIHERLSETESLKVVSLFSHLAASEDLSQNTFTLQQIENFTRIAKEMSDLLGFQPIRHQSNTSAILNFPQSHFDMVRTGIGLYGYGNSPEEDALLKPVAKLKSVISQIHKIEPDESVGYNRAYRAKGFEVTATLPIGHADGISRQFGNEKGYVLVNGERAPIIGNVCMDMLMINVTGLHCKEGDEVIIIGEENPASTFAEHAGTISYELLTAISQRVQRVIKRKDPSKP